MRVCAWRGCGRWPVFGGFLCSFEIGQGVLGVMLGAGAAGVADSGGDALDVGAGEAAVGDVLGAVAAGVAVGSGCFRW